MEDLATIDYELLACLMRTPCSDQRQLSRLSGLSLGRVNKSLAALRAAGYLTEKMIPTEKALEEGRLRKPENAVILAAGFGLRMIPVGHEISKGMIEIGGVPIIERLIEQLREAGIGSITIVVGFMKEAYEYLIDKYQVKLIRNGEYDKKNSYHSLYLARAELGNTYIVPCDIWCDVNPFSPVELIPWYMISEQITDNSFVQVNRKRQLVENRREKGNRMLGVAYVTREVSALLKENLEAAERDEHRKNDCWEDEAMRGGRMLMAARPVSSAVFHEINTYEELRDFDARSRNLESLAISLSAKALGVGEEEIEGISPMKMGMTNRSFLFTCRGEKYIMRIPGEGTDRLINREGEKQAYDAIKGLGISDEVLYLDPKTGYKLTRYIENAVMCDFNDDEDVVKMFNMLHRIRRMKLRTETTWDIFREMERYESLWQGPSAYRDYEEVKKKILTLRPYIEAHKHEAYLNQMDPAAENFLKVKNPDGTEKLILLDWEYASMFDDLFGLTEFCLYTGNDKAWVDHMIDLYYETAGEHCSEEDRTLIYCYMSTVGLMWTAWCEAKRFMGVDFTDYSMNQYRYAKDFYRYATERMNQDA